MTGGCETIVGQSSVGEKSCKRARVSSGDAIGGGHTSGTATAKWVQHCGHMNEKDMLALENAHLMGRSKDHISA